MISRIVNFHKTKHNDVINGDWRSDSFEREALREGNIRVEVK